MTEPISTAPGIVNGARSAAESVRATTDAEGKPSKPQGPRLDLQATITEEDLLGFNRAWARLSGEASRAVWTGRALALVPIAGGIAVIILGDKVLGGALAALGVVLAVGAEPYYRAAVRRAVHQQAAGRNPAMLGPRRIVIDQTGVFDGGRYDRLQVGWAGVTDLAVGKEGLYIFYGTMQAVIVPKRAFRSPAEFERGVSIVERYVGRRATATNRA